MKHTENIDWSVHFYYDETSKSHLRRKAEWRCGKDGKILRASAGDEAGWLSVKGYYYVEFCGKSYLCHRIVYSLHHKLERYEDIDHVNGDRANNNILNLRAVQPTTNQRNKEMYKSNTSGVAGVWLHTQTRLGITSERWAAQWYDSEGKLVNKYFSIGKYGERRAFEMACVCRKEAVTLLNAAGAGYTERHGLSN